MTQTILTPVPGEFITFTMNAWTEPFWQATKERRLVVPRCGACGIFRLPPGPFCPHCQSQTVEWVAPGGRGVLFSYTLCHKSPFPGKVADFTYAPAVIELPDAGNVRLVGNIVDMVPDDIRIGMELEVGWSPTRDGWAVPVFRRPTGGAA